MEKKNKEKFEFQPFDKVLARDYKNKWATNFFSYYEGGEALTLGGCEWTEVIPFEGNEHLLGTTDPYVETKSESEYVPKDGDFVTFVAYVSKIKFTAICQNYNSCSMLYYVGTIGRERNEIHFNNAYSLDSRDVVKPATGDEKNELLSKLHEIGKDWDKETKQIVAYNPPYEPKDGDFVAIETENFLWISIFKKFDGDKVLTYADYMNGSSIADETGGGFLCLRDDIERFRSATEDEIDKFVDAYKDAGKVWNAEEKVFEKYVWEPSIGDTYYYPDFNRILCKFEPCETQCSEDGVDSIRMERNFVSRTEEECQVKCENLNAALESVEGYVDSER